MAEATFGSFFSGGEYGVLIDPIVRHIIVVSDSSLRSLRIYEYEPRPPLECPITVFGGVQDDDVLREQLEGWRDYTTSSFAMRMFPGNHFYLHTSAPVLLRMIAQDLSNTPEGIGPQ